MSNRISIESQLKEASQLIEIEYMASSAAGANDGYLKLWLNDTLVDTLSGIDNDTRLVDNASLGAVASLDAGTSGTIYFDSFESRRGSHIGPLAYQAPSRPAPNSRKLSRLPTQTVPSNLSRITLPECRSRSFRACRKWICRINSNPPPSPLTTPTMPSTA